MDNQLNSLANNSEKHLSKTQKFLENTKRAVRKTLAATGIAASTMGPMATTTTSTVIPASVNTITAVVPSATSMAEAISLGTAASLMTACGGKDDPDGPIDTKDTTPPTINVSKSEIDITGGKEIRISGSQLYIGSDLVASWSDNKTKNCAVLLSINGKTITSGTTLSEEGTLTIKVSDDAGNIKSTDIKLNMVKNAPSITVNQYEVNIFGGTTVNLKDNQLLFGDEVIASRNDDNLESCKVSLSFNGQDIKSGDKINDAGMLTITVTNKNSITSTAEITIKNDAIFGLENLRNASIQVDKEINLLNGITFADGVELVKTEVEIDGKRNTVSDPNHYTSSYPGTMNVIFTLKGKSGNTAEVKVDNLTIKAMEYKAMSITNINPEDLMPKIESGDWNAYKHIEHLRVPEATVVTDMMWKYGAGNHSPEEYQQLMMRLNTGMIGENPVGYNNYEAVGGIPGDKPSRHAHAEWFILNTLVKHANFKVIDPSHGDHHDILYNLCKTDPSKINIIGISVGADVNKAEYDGWHVEKYKEYDKEKNRLVFCAGGNIMTENDNLYNKVCQENFPLPDEHSVYGGRSRAHGKNDNTLNRHVMVTFGTDSDGDIDQTDETVESSKFPVGFHDKVLFSGRDFPYRLSSGEKVKATLGKYATSFANYFNVAIACILFQMKADTPDVDEFLNMVRATALSTDYIRFDLNGDGDTNDNYNGQPESQPLQLMNPAGFFKKYLMPTNLPSTLQSSKTAALNKGYYKGVIFDIPGAEVKINGQWIAYNDANKSQIKSQNPMNLEWRINGDLCRKMGYKGKSASGKIIVVDDKWNGLNIDKDFSISIQ